MNGGSNPAGLHVDDEASDVEATPAPAVEELLIRAWGMPEEEPPAPSRWPAVAALVATLAWIAGAFWFLLPEIAGRPAMELVQVIAALCVPPLLVGVGWLLFQRTSHAEARRFGDVAQRMRAEAHGMERAVAALSEKLEANRALLAAQAKELAEIGDRTAERLAAVSTSIVRETAAVNGAARTLTEAASGAERSLDIVLTTLPRAHDDLRAMTATLDQAGLAASERAASLEAQLAVLAERGREADRVAADAGGRLVAHIARMEATSETAGAKLERVTSDMSAAVDGVLERAAQAIDEARKGITAQGEAMLAMLRSNHAALDQAGREGSEALAERIARVEEAIGRLADRLQAEHARAGALFEEIDKGVASTGGRFDSLHADGTAKAQELAASLSALTGSAEAMIESMRVGDATARSVISTAESLLTALDASAREIDETLPGALDRLDRRIGQSRQVVGQAKPELLALVTAAESTHDAIEAIATVIAGQRDTLARISASLLETLETGRARIDGVQEVVDATIERSEHFTAEIAPQLIEALLRIREAANQAAADARGTLAEVIPEASSRLAAESSAAMERALEGAVSKRIGLLAATAAEAVRAAQSASQRLDQQIASIRAAATAIEQQVEEARNALETAERDSVARRASLLIEAMNSAAIDIAKTFSQEVSDTAWAAYLKGDRGVFTRRAVRLLDAANAREIVRLYDDDPDFREQVNRYIHDFEAMLRQILTQRDGSPLGITLLSSDMGKLYVALAQAIERLRT